MARGRNRVMMCKIIRCKGAEVEAAETTFDFTSVRFGFIEREYDDVQLIFLESTSYYNLLCCTVLCSQLNSTLSGSLMFES